MEHCWHASVRSLCIDSSVRRTHAPNIYGSLHTDLCYFRIPNLPFFYLVYRAWSHWRALAGGDHLEFLVKNKLLALSPSKTLDDIYNPLLPSDPAKRVLTPPAQTGPLEKEPELSPDEAILLTQENGRQIAEALELPELEVEMERAIWQINRAKQKINDKQDKGISPTYQKEDPADTKKKP